MLLPNRGLLVSKSLGASVHTVRRPEAARAAKRIVELARVVVAKNLAAESRIRGGQIEDPILHRSRRRPLASPMASQLLKRIGDVLIVESSRRSMHFQKNISITDSA